VKCVLRVDGKKFQLKWEGLVASLHKVLEEVQDLMFKNAKVKFDQKQKTADNWKEFMTHLNNRNVILTPWCESRQCEEKVK
jgi:prolyl-tRNA synthetase